MLRQLGLLRSLFLILQQQTVNSGPLLVPVNVQGKYTLRAQFPGDSVYSSVSAARTFYVDTTKPTVSITSPAQSSTFTTGSPVALKATATDKLLSASTTNDGKVKQVTFYYRSSTATTFTLIATDTASPYSTTWTAPTTAGIYHLMARATDVAGNAQNSAQIGITVTSSAVLTINTIPGTGANKPLTISGTLKDATTNAAIADKTITFTSSTGTTVVPASVTTAADGTFKTTATTVSTEGQFVARAQFAGDNLYKSTSAAKTFYVDITKPTVSLTSPPNGATFTAGSPITINAIAADKLLSTSTINDGKILRVSFYYRPSTSTTPTLITTDTASLYSTTWTAPSTPGIYYLWARATDVAGNALNSVTIGVTVR